MESRSRAREGGSDFPSNCYSRLLKRARAAVPPDILHRKGERRGARTRTNRHRVIIYYWGPLDDYSIHCQVAASLCYLQLGGGAVQRKRTQQLCRVLSKSDFGNFFSTWVIIFPAYPPCARKLDRCFLLPEKGPLTPFVK